jgi:hypothetical protein
MARDVPPRRAERKARRAKVRGVGPSAPQLSAWERLSWGAQHAIGIGFLLLVTLGFLFPVTFGDRALVGGDIVQWRGMAEAMLQYEEETGDRALWAPNAFGGMPGYLIHYPRVVPQLDTVVAMLRRAGWWPGAHLFVLLIGTYLLVFYLTRDVLSSVLGAVAYGLTTYIPIILTAGHNTKFVAMAFAPWLLLAFAFALRRPPGAGWIRAFLGALLFAVALAVNLRADHVQITYYVAFALGVMWIVEGVGAIREGEARAFGISTAVLALGGLLGVVMVAHPYLPLAEYKAFTIRSAGEGGGLAWDYAMQWSQGVGELVTLLIPGAYGSDGATYWGPKPFTAGPHYVGPVVLLLAGLALYGVRRRLVTGLGMAAALMVLFSLGEHFVLLNRPMFQFFPLFDAFRVPETWLAAVALLLAVLAGGGVYYVSRREPSPEAVERKTHAVYAALAATGGLIVLVLLAGSLFFPFEAPGEFERITQAVSQQSGVPASDPRVAQAASGYLSDMRSERRGMFFGDGVRALVILLIAGGLLVLQRRQRLPRWACQVALLLLLLGDLWQVGTRYFNADHPALRATAAVERAIPQYPVDPFILARVEVAGGPGHFRTLPLALNPFNDGRTPYFYESVGGYHGAKLALFQDYIDHLLFLPDGRLNPTALDLMATRFVIAAGPLPGMEVAFRDERTGLLVLERPDAAPRAWLVDDVRVEPDREATLALLRDPAFDLRRTVILAEPLAEPLPELQADPLAPAVPQGLPSDTLDTTPGRSISLVRYTPREIVWEVETDRPRLFVASEVYYPAGWTATVAGDPATIHRANHLLRAVKVPEGRHLVMMRYAPEMDRRSLAVSMWATALVYLATMLVLGLWWYRGGHTAP